MDNIHSLAIIDNAAVVGKNVKIGPFSSVGPGVVLEDGVKIHENVVIKGKTLIGSQTEIHPFTAIGLPPQDLKYEGEESEIIIGKNCQIREHATIHGGTAAGGLVTQIGDNCLLMVGCHIAHDCIIGNNVVMANASCLAGHVTLGDFCKIGGLSAVLQFVTIGKHAMIGGLTGVTNDVTPYAMIFGARGYLCGLNIIGLKRHGFNRSVIKEIKSIYQFLFYTKEDTFQNRLIAAQSLIKTPHGQEIINFLSTTDSKKRVCQPRRSDVKN